MADDRIGVYFVPPPSKPSRPDWRAYLLGYIVPGIIFLAALRVLAEIFSWLI
jgi:hypothetical protein